MKTRVNYKSDLPPVAVKFRISDAEVDVPNHDFVIRFFVDGAPGTSFECGRKGDEYFNCEKTDSSTLTCYIDNHHFGCGRLCCEFVDFSADSNYADGVRKTVTPSKLDIVLVEGPSDTATGIDASVVVDLEGLIAEITGKIGDISTMQSDIEQLKSGISDKLSYYDASWIRNEYMRTEDNFNALKAALQAGKVIIVYGVTVVAELPQDNVIYVSDTREAGNDTFTMVLENGEVSTEEGVLSFVDMEYADNLNDTISGLGNRTTSLEGRFSTLQGSTGATKVGYYNSADGYSGKHNVKEVLDYIISTVPRYHSLTWLDNEQGSISAEHPERRQLIRYTSLSGAISSGKLMLNNGFPAIHASEHGDVITVKFFDGAVIKTYTVTKYTDYCTVSYTTQSINVETPEQAGN